MPDPTYKTFLSPGSCQLEITDLVAAANDDTGIDLYGVAWEIEQVLIAGEGFAAAPTDVWVNERGILNIGQSLFDKINRTAEDNDNVPGQCTVVVKATSLVDSSKVARLKVLVGYPGEGGGGGGGGGGSETRTIQLLCVEIDLSGNTIGPTSASITAPTVSLIDVETQQGTPVDIGEKSTVTVDEITGVWKYEFDVTVGEIYSIGGETMWTIGEFGQYLNSDAQDPTVITDVFASEQGFFTSTNYSTTVIISTENII